MPRTDDVPIRITSPDYRDSRNSLLEEWLSKEAKEAEQANKPADDESKSTVGYTDLYPHESKAVSGPDRTSEDSLLANQHDAAQRARREVASRAYATLPAAAKTERALLNANFAHAASGDFITHSVLLQEGAKEASATLAGKVRALRLGRA